MANVRKFCRCFAVLTLMAVAGCGFPQSGAAGDNAGARKIINLDGAWEVAEGSMDSPPAGFTHKVPVPGLVDMAEPAFAEVGKKSDKRQAFWYRRTFTVKVEIPEVAILKIHKARYGTKVFLNGQVVGEHLPCFTPALMDVKKFFKGAGRENELVIRLGADRESLPEGQPTGWDFEKYKYIPGIYDSVELILSGAPHIANVQTVPDIDKSKVRVVVEMDNVAGADKIEIRYKLSGARTAKPVRSGVAEATSCSGDEKVTVDFEVPVPDCRLWTPDDPFLYELELRTAGDCKLVRFGMRSFRFDPETKRAMLNGKPCFMRGTNVCIYRFFEDDARGDKPWRKEWVRKLHRKFKSMHWNSIRYCIGFPPELWYEIADEEGFLIQDEFPIWLLDKAPENPRAEKIIPEYIEWMRERWNHACVVLWDGQNESVTPETGKAISAVRHLDLSGRPWDNGWAEPQSPADCVEAHPYLFIKAWQDQMPFRFRDIANTSPVPSLRAAQKKLDAPIVINEYGWLWLNRDGTPTTISRKIYESLGLWPDGTAEDRRLLYARYLAGLTEFWRCHRECAGVLHFCGLGYSRPGFEDRPIGGATSDHFINIEKLVFEPNFEKYVRDAFCPVGLMLDLWDEEISPGAERQVKVFVISDLYRNWKGTVDLQIVRGKQVVGKQSKPCTVESLGREILAFEQKFPTEAGDYRLVAQLAGDDGKPVRSIRDFKVVASSK
jgi:beta-galactosidase